MKIIFILASIIVACFGDVIACCEVVINYEGGDLKWIFHVHEWHICEKHCEERKGCAKWTLASCKDWNAS